MWMNASHCLLGPDPTGPILIETLQRGFKLQTKGFFSFAQSVESAVSHNHHHHQTLVSESEFDKTMMNIWIDENGWNFAFGHLPFKPDINIYHCNWIVITDHTERGVCVKLGRQTKKFDYSHLWRNCDDIKRGRSKSSFDINTAKEGAIQVIFMSAGEQVLSFSANNVNL